MSALLNRKIWTHGAVDKLVRCAGRGQMSGLLNRKIWILGERERDELAAGSKSYSLPSTLIESILRSLLARAKVTCVRAVPNDMRARVPAAFTGASSP